MLACRRRKGRREVKFWKTHTLHPHFLFYCLFHSRNGVCGGILGTASLAKEYTEDPAGRKGSAKEAEKTTVRSKQTKAGKRQAPTSTNLENERKFRHFIRNMERSPGRSTHGYKGDSSQNETGRSAVNKTDRQKMIMGESQARSVSADDWALVTAAAEKGLSKGQMVKHQK